MSDPVRETAQSDALAAGSAIDPVEEILADCLALPEGERAHALEDAGARHPELAAELRARVEALRAMGIELADPALDFPEQLGDFRLIERLGGGGMGVVYLAVQTSLKRDVALKLIRPEHLFFEGSRARFRREAEAVARLQHPGIVPIFAVGEEQGIPYFAMERIRGCTLAEALRSLRARAPESLRGADLQRVVGELAGSREPLQEGSAFDGSWIETCLRIARQVADALQHAHERGLVHRDVKPSNIALTPDGRAMLLDFGLARLENVVETGQLTRTGSALGTLHYMSPEHVRGGREVDERSDVYSLGVTVYEMLALQLPYRGENPLEVQRLLLDGRPDPIRPRNRRVDADVETVVLCAIDRDPSRRYASAADFARDLGHLLARRPIEARRPGSLLRARRWFQRHPAAGTAVVLGPALVLSAASAIVAREKSHSRALGTSERAERQRADDVLSLSAIQDLQDLEERADRLWPAHPENLGTYEEWLRDARALVEGRPADEGRGLKAKPGLTEHRRKLAELEARALPRSEEERAAERVLEAAEMQETVSRRREWTFERSEDRWWHVQLSKLVAALESFTEPKTGLFSSGVSSKHGWGIGKRAEFARMVEERSVSGTEPARLWAEAIASIRDRSRCPQYDGLAIAPQLGLLPIGRDPASGLWEFAHLQTGEPAERGTEGKLVLKEEMGLVLVLIPGGTFAMGAQSTDPTEPNYDPQALEDESPVQDVTLSPYFLSKYEMTQGQWERFVGQNPSTYGPDRYAPKWNREGRGWSSLHPVEQVTWWQCKDVMRWLGLSLPSEAQWERAARGGTDTPYWTGSDLESLRGAANLADAYGKGHGGDAWSAWDPDFDDGHTVHARVGSDRANPFGLHDVHGNLLEWCLDGYDGTIYGRSPSTDPVAPMPGASPRVYRGGCFLLCALNARVAKRSYAMPEHQNYGLGLRPARAVTQPGTTALDAGSER